MFRKAFVVLVVLLAACVDTVPQRRNTSISVTDDAGRAVELSAPAMRVVSLVPTVTDLIIAMRGQNRLIARTDYDTDPRVAHLPSLGGGLTPGIEWLAAQKPHLVISWPDHGSRSLVTRLATINIPAYAARTESIEDSYRILEHLGVLLDLRQQADSLTRAIRSELDAVRNEAAGKPRVVVAYVVGVDPPMVAASGTFIDELITIAGGRNAFPELKLWPQVSLEAMVQRNPDAIVLADTDTTDAVTLMQNMPGWRDLKAVKHGRVHRVSPYLFNRSGPSMPSAAHELAQFFQRR